MSEVWTVLAILRWTTDFFRERGVTSPRLDAELLLAKVLGTERIQLYVQHDRPLDPDERAAVRGLVKRRAGGEPVQYILGEQEFWSIPFEVRPGVLIPRADTECLVEEAVAEAERIITLRGTAALRLADVGTGSGCIAVALASQLEQARVVAGDIAEVPLELAPRNAERAGVGDRVTVLRADGLLPLWEHQGREPFDLVASNPPYLTHAELPGLMREVRDHEPVEALVSGDDGLDLIRRLLAEVTTPGVLAPGAAFLLEISGAAQAAAVADMLVEAGFADVRIRNDYAEIPRVVVARADNG